MLEVSVASSGLLGIGRAAIYRKILTITEKFTKLFMVASEINPNKAGFLRVVFSGWVKILEKISIKSSFLVKCTFTGCSFTKIFAYFCLFLGIPF